MVKMALIFPNFLVEKGYTVFGGSKRSSMDSLYRLRVLGIEDKIELINFDLNDPYNVRTLSLVDYSMKYII